MKGLLVKDFRLFKNQKNFFIVVFIMVFLFLLTGTNTTFVIGYATILSAFFSLSTINYDEHNNGNAFLFTMPFTRKEYILEKYLFGLLAGGGAWLFSTVAGIGFMLLNQQKTDMMEWGIMVFVIFMMLFPMLSIMIPLELKFGAEKSRIAMFIMVLGVVAAGEAVGGVCEKLGIDVRVLLEMAGSIKTAAAVVICLVIIIVGAVLSYLISVHIIEKIEF